MICEPSCTEGSTEVVPHELSALCRLCATKMDKMTSIFDSADTGMKVIRQIQDCLSIVIREKDIVSKLICTLCKENLKKFHEFRNNILKRNEIFESAQNALKLQSANKKIFDPKSEEDVEGDENKITGHSIKLPCRICSACNQVLEDGMPGAKHNKNCENSASTRDNPAEIREIVLDSVFKCEYCDRCYVDMKSIKIHKTCHVGEEPYVCLACDVYYSTYKQLTKHKAEQCKSTDAANAKDLATTGIPKYFSCLHCNKTFMHFRSMNIHQKSCSSTASAINQLNSCVCGDRFMDSEGLAEHNSSEVNKRWQCQRCFVSFGSVCALRRHKKQPHARQFICADCGKEFLQKSHLAIHVKRHMAELSLKCPLCDMSFSTSSRLRNHAKFHNNPKPFRCNVCDKAFKRFSARKIHMTIHTGEKAFKCDVCEKAFKRKADMRKHKKTRHRVNSFNTV